MSTTQEQQLILELINRARANPAGEYDELVPNDVGMTSLIQQALSQFGVDLDVLQNQLADYDAVAPLAFNDSLAQSAETHNDLMIANDQQSHNFSGELSLRDRIEDAGYDNLTSYGENIYAYAYDPIFAHAGFYIDWGNTSTGIQMPAGHRNSILSANFTEFGVAWEEQSGSSSTGPFVTTQHFANSSDYQSQLVGVVIDDLDGDDFYDIGEALGNVSITVFGQNGTFVTSSWASGGYQLVVPDGIYTVIFQGGGLGGVIVSDLTMDGENIKIDAISDTAASSGIDLSGFTGSDDMYGTSYADTLSGNSGADDITTRGGNDIANGNNGSDTINGNNGNDTLSGGNGKDKLYGDNGADVLNGGKGNDKLFGGNGNDELYGGGKNDVLNGNNKNDDLFGGGGSDKLYGGKGKDTLEGGAGDDTLKGGLGADTFVFDTGHDSDTITDFDADADTIEISAALAQGQTVQQIISTAFLDGGNDLILEFGSGDQIRLEGFTDTTALEQALIIDI